jgi:hypothetical protein
MEVFSARPVAVVLPKPAMDKLIREQRTSRIYPGVYDAVERERKRQKRSRKRASWSSAKKGHGFLAKRNGLLASFEVGAQKRRSTLPTYEQLSRKVALNITI